MKANLCTIASLMLAALFWYGYTYSLTIQAFPIQGIIGALIPCGIGAWLFACGTIIARLK